MTNLKLLNVSLTKHGAHKVALLLRKYKADEVLSHLWGSEPGVNIETAQARKTLGADGQGNVPSIWADAKIRGTETIDALVFIAILFSHHQLISAMTKSINKSDFSGRIRRGDVLDAKAYTNFAHIIEELGYSTDHTTEHVDFYLRRLFKIKDLHQLVSRLFSMRLQLAGWDQKTPLIDECIAQGFHKALAVSDAQLRGWLSTGTLSTSREGTTDFEDSDFFSNAKDGLPSSGFVFRSGHNEKKTGSVTVKKAPADSTATLIHNEIQNSLFAKLVKQHGTEHVGTEVATGDGTSIDIVVQTPNFCHFYEIKTGESVKACIRQAIPQLLEYAYWHGKNDRIDSLVIVSQLPPTKEANRYLNFLQSEFGIPISYLQHKISK